MLVSWSQELQILHDVLFLTRWSTKTAANLVSENNVLVIQWIIIKGTVHPKIQILYFFTDSCGSEQGPLLHRVSLDVKLTEPVKVWKGMKSISKHTTHSKALGINLIRESTTKTVTTKGQFTPHHQTQTSADSWPVCHFSDIPRADKCRFNWRKQAPTNASRRWHTVQTKPDQRMCCHLSKSVGTVWIGLKRHSYDSYDSYDRIQN